MKVASITTVYAPTKTCEADAKRTLLALLDARCTPVIAATDLGRRDWWRWCRANEVLYVPVTGGHAPRMNRLLAAALGQCRTDLVWTVEQGTAVERTTMAVAEAVFRDTPANVAGLALESLDAHGERNFPSSADIPCRTRPWGPDPALLEVVSAHGRPPYNTFNATLWRRNALAVVDWTACPPLGHCDVVAGGQMATAGYTHLIAPGLTCIHEPHTARNAARFHGDRHATAVEG